jgi:hypothetical protein
MLLRDHPEFSPWPPNQNAIASVIPVSEKEVPFLRVLRVIIRAPSTIDFLLRRFDAGTCHLVKDLKDDKFALALYDARNKLVTKTLREIGDVEIPLSEPS